MKIIANTHITEHLKIATILDTFSYQVFDPEALLLQLTPQNFKEELQQFQPDFLFIESAWRGKDDLWTGKIKHCADELVQIINYCKQKQIPTVFWNKEDPYHFDDFLKTAALFDFVFTTDITCIPLYKEKLNHQNVFLLPFSVQPKLHNPIETYERKHTFVFAGAYYSYYPERNAYFQKVVTILSTIAPIEIYDRHEGTADKRLKYPDIYRNFIKGKLAYEEIDKAYKGYSHAINLNSITTSPTMFSRRVLELMASNTLVISNYTVGIKTLLGELCISTNNMEKLLERISTLQNDTFLNQKIRLAGLRKVLLEHTAKVRLDYICSHLFKAQNCATSPHVLCIAKVGSDEELCTVQHSFMTQQYQNKLLLVFTNDTINKALVFDENIHIVSKNTDKTSIQKILTHIESINYLAGLSTQDYYGKNYLTDLVLATQYCNSVIITKGGFYYDGRVQNDDRYKPYTFTNTAYLRSSLVKQPVTAIVDLITLSEEIETKQFNEENILQIDTFNYCKNSTISQLNISEKNLIDDLTDIDTGIELTEDWIEKQVNIIEHQNRHQNKNIYRRVFWDKLSHNTRKKLKPFIPKYLLDLRKR